MTDKKSSKTTESSDIENGTKGKSPLDDIEVIKALDEAYSKKEQTGKAEPKKAMPKSSTPSPEKQPRNVRTQTHGISKIGLLAFFLGLIAIVCAGAAYWYGKQELQVEFSQRIAEASANLLKENDRLAQELNQDKARLNSQLQQALTRLAADMQQSQANLRDEVNALTKQTPGDWQLNEAEFLIRAANRTLTLEKNKATVSSLLLEADKRIVAMNDPQYIDLRSAIREDIESLALLPDLETDTIIVSLMALANQVENLSFPDRPSLDNEQIDEELTNDIADWQENLSKTWRRFLKDFITINRRSEEVQPLLEPQNQNVLRQNLSLKIQQAQWAASKESKSLFVDSLHDVESWLKRYFDTTTTFNKNFIERVQAISKMNVSVDYPTALTSLAKVRQKISQRQQTPVPIIQTPKTEPKQSNLEKAPATETTKDADTVEQESI